MKQKKKKNSKVDKIKGKAGYPRYSYNDDGDGDHEHHHRRRTKLNMKHAMKLDEFRLFHSRRRVDV